MRKHIFCLFNPIAMVGVLAAFSWTGCSSDSDGTETPAGNDEYAESVPDSEMLKLNLEESTVAAETAGLYQAPLVGDPAALKASAQGVVDRVNEAIAKTQEIVDEVFAAATPVTRTVGQLTCRVWEADGPAGLNHWRLAVCVRDLVAKRYSFVIKGRPIAATREIDYRIVLGGQGRVFPRLTGKRRGAGIIGYNFDNLHELTGQGATGKVAIGYRAVGRLRQLAVGLLNYQAEGAPQAISALYRFGHLLGVGGHLRFLADADFIAPATEGAGFVLGTDGISELGRIAVGWVRAGAARVAVAVCGGTIGAGTCAYARQCWHKDGHVTFEDIAAGNADLAWDPAQCPADQDVAIPVDDPPAEDDLAMPADSTDEEVPGPAVAEPAEMPELENADSATAGQSDQ